MFSCSHGMCKFTPSPRKVNNYNWIVIMACEFVNVNVNVNVIISLCVHSVRTKIAHSHNGGWSWMDWIEMLHCPLPLQFCGMAKKLMASLLQTVHTHTQLAAAALNWNKLNGKVNVNGIISLYHHSQVECHYLHSFISFHIATAAAAL